MVEEISDETVSAFFKGEGAKANHRLTNAMLLGRRKFFLPNLLMRRVLEMYLNLDANI